VSGGHFSLLLISFSFCRFLDSGGRGLAIVISAFLVVSMNVSTPLVVLAACSTTLVISLSTVVLLALVSLSRNLRDIDGASAAVGSSGDGKDNMSGLPCSTLSLPPTVGTMSPPDRMFALLAVTGCMATAAGGFGSVVFLRLCERGCCAPNGCVLQHHR
jgi:hypothetical protein